jgi:hypothetical protein
MNNSIKKPFIPRDKPKSFILAIIAGLTGLLVAGPLMFAEYFWGLKMLAYIGKLLFVFSWTVGMVMGIVFASGLITGRYRNIEEKDWTHQIW